MFLYKQEVARYIGGRGIERMEALYYDLTGGNCGRVRLYESADSAEVVEGKDPSR